MGRITRIFFDVDGVLIDGFHTRPERWKRWDTTLEQDLGVKSEHLQEIFGTWFTSVQQGKADFHTEMERWLKAAGYTVPAQALIDYWHRKDASLSPAFKAVEHLSGRPDVALYTATNQNHQRIDYFKSGLGWDRHFTDFYYSARLGCLKHDPDFFAQIETDLGVDPKQEMLLYFDDDKRNIHISSVRGWNAVLVDGPEDVLNHPVIKDLMAAK